MSKRIIILALALVIGTAFAAYAEVQNVKVGGDFTAMAFGRYGFNLAKEQQDIQGLAQIANIKVMADLTDAVSATMIVRNERIWGGSTGSANTSAASTATYLAVGFVTLKDFIQEGWTFKVGQQVFKAGSGLVWGDPSTNQSASATSNPFYYELGDMDPRIAATGVIATMDYSPLALTVFAVKTNEGSLSVNGDDTNSYMIMAGYDLKDILDFKSSAEFAYTLEDAHKADIQVFDFRTMLAPADNLDVSAEYAVQARKGFRADGDSAWDNALQLAVTMGLPDVEMSPTVGLDYTRLSSNWETMYETMVPADIANAIFANTNVSCIGATATAKPMDDVKLRLRYANLRLIDGLSAAGSASTFGAYTLNSSKKRIGDEIDLHLTYDYTADVQFKLMGGYFMPGSAFDESNEEKASQVIGSMKVTF